MRALVTFVVAATAMPMAAQMYVPPFNFTPQIAARIVTPQLEAQKERQRRQGENDEPHRSVTVSRLSIALLTYTPTPSRTRTNIATFAARNRAVDPQGTAAMEALFASSDVMATVEMQLRTVGLTRPNVADAYAAWWTTAWLAMQGRNETSPRIQMQAVKRQASDAMLAAPGVATMTDAQKQEMAEALLVQAMLIGASVDAAKEQPSLMAPLKAAVAKGAKASGLDLAAMTLTDAGFRMAEAK